jgi:hypothetical protein
MALNYVFQVVIKYTRIYILRPSKIYSNRDFRCDGKPSGNPGCQMVHFQTKNPNLGKFWRALPRLENVDIFYGHWEYLTDIWEIS